MPTHEHEVIAMLFRDDPRLAVDLLRDVLQVPLPAENSVTVATGDLSDARPAQYQADSLIVLRDAAGEPVQVVVLEIQRSPDDDKQWSWPAYLTLARRQHRCPGALLVVATDERTAAWARQPIRLDPRHEWSPFVVGPVEVPRVEDTETVRRFPQLSVLSALLHRDAEEDARVLLAVLNGLKVSGFSEKDMAYYTDAIMLDVGRRARRGLERIMPAPPDFQFRSEFFLKHINEAKEHAQKEGREEGREKGREEGREEVLASFRKLLLTVLADRGFEVTADLRARVEHCAEAETLSRWITRTVHAASAAEVLDSGGD